MGAFGFCHNESISSFVYRYIPYHYIPYGAKLQELFSTRAAKSYFSRQIWHKNPVFCVYLWQNRKDLAKIADGTSLLYKAVCTCKLTAHIPRSSPGCFEKFLPPRVWSRVGGAAVRCRLPPTDTALAYYVREAAPSRSLYISSAARRAFATGVSVCGKQ